MIYNDSKYNSHWDIKALNELGEFKRGKSKHRPRNDKRLFFDGKYPLIQTGEIRSANLYINNHTEMYNDFGLKQSALWKENTLCITIAANIAETALLGYPMCFPDSVVGFNAYPNESSELFMHYVFTYIKRSIQNSASGSIQDNINIDYLTSLKFRIPQKNYQDKITDVLSSLDNKIELNNRINTKLEQIAKAIFDLWFVQFDFPNKNGKPYKSSGGKMVWNEELKREIPEGWKKGTLKNIIKLNPSLSIPLNTSASYIDMDALPTSGFMTKEVQKKSFTGGVKFQNGDVVIARITPCLENGKTALITLLEADEIGFGSTEFIVLRGKDTKLSCFAAYLSRSELFRKFAIMNMTGTSGRKRIEASTLENFQLAIPPVSLLSQFEEIVTPFFSQETKNTKESSRLIKLRDWLMPMLMNGQVTIQN